MKRNIRNVIFQAPFGIGCAAMAAPPQFAFPARFNSIDRVWRDAIRGIGNDAM
jgi:hypothetical protein